nr:ribonuclease H-like domain-containing protein [Tanacetum cinerariifolium]
KSYCLVITDDYSRFSWVFVLASKDETPSVLKTFIIGLENLLSFKNNNKDALVDGKEHDDDIQKSVSPDIYSSSSGAQTRKQGDKTENKDKGKSHVVTITGFRDLNEEFEECIGTTNKALCQSFEKLMKDKFQMSSMGELTFFLGIQVKQKKDRIFISQDKYVAKILRKFRLSEGKLASTLIDAEKPLLKDSDGEDVDVHTYRSMIGPCVNHLRN